MDDPVAPLSSRQSADRAVPSSVDDRLPPRRRSRKPYSYVNPDTPTLPGADAPTARRRLAPFHWRRSREHDTLSVIREGLGPEQVEQRDRTYRRLLACADVVSAVLALSLAIFAGRGDTLRASALIALPVVVLASKIIGLYDRDELLIRKSTLDEAPQLFQLSTLYALVVWLAAPVLVDGTLGSSQVLVLWFTLFSSTFVARTVARRLAARATSTERCLFFGDAATYGRLQSKLSDHPSFELVGRMSLQRPARTGARDTKADDLGDLLAWTDVHRVIIEPQALPDDEMHDLVRGAKSVGVRVSLLPRVLDVVGSSVVFDELGGMTVLGVRRFGLSRSSMRVKRTFDLVGATGALVILGPLMALVALAIKLDSKGPVLFRQERVGRAGRRFRICKFRTMVVDAEARKAGLVGSNEAGAGLFKIENDPRITRVGRLLRRTSLDELPQLFNVVAGSMSLVGPRPLILSEDERITGYDRRRLALTPGMTGHWQILGSARVPMHEMVKIDYLYVAGWSLWADTKILLRTVPYMLARRGM